MQVSVIIPDEYLASRRWRLAKWLLPAEAQAQILRAAKTMYDRRLAAEGFDWSVANSLPRLHRLRCWLLFRLGKSPNLAIWHVKRNMAGWEAPHNFTPTNVELMINKRKDLAPYSSLGPPFRTPERKKDDKGVPYLLVS